MADEDKGKKFDTGKSRYDLLAPDSLEELALVLTFGANKYADRNWEKGIKFGRLLAAAMRHMWTLWRGELIDPETNLLHSAHAECNMHFLTHFLKNYEHYKEFDDRPPVITSSTSYVLSPSSACPECGCRESIHSLPTNK